MALAVPAIGSTSSLDHAHRGRPGDGPHRLRHRLGADADLRPHGRAEFRPRRVHRARCLRRHQRHGLWRRRGLERLRRRLRGDGGGHGRGRRRRLGLRARHRAPGLRPAPQADPHHDGRHDRRRGDHQGHLGAAADRAAAARRTARRLAVRRRRRSRNTACWRRPSAWWCWPRWCSRSTAPRSACSSAPACRTAAWSRRWATASGACSSASSSPARRWPGLGGVLWGLYQQSVTPQIGAQVNVLIFIVIIIGGLGSHLRLPGRRAAGRV